MDDHTQTAPATNPGEPLSSELLLPLVYEELRKLAAQKLAREKPGQTLQATALVHEAYLRIAGSGQSPRWNSQGHFFAAAAEAIRRILIERARHRHSLKAGGDRGREDLPEIEVDEMVRGLDLLALDEALVNLEKLDVRKAELVKLRFFAGLTLAEAAGVLGIARSTADDDWAYARSWLRLELEGNQGGKPPTGSATAR
jgi:RNA polymerase sigma factor (TIGR02999 family)